MSSQFDEYITYKALGRKFDDSGRLLDLILDNSPDDPEAARISAELKQICAKISPAVIDRLDSITAFLDISKREFIELALIEAVRRAEEISHESLNEDAGGI